MDESLSTNTSRRVRCLAEKISAILQSFTGRSDQSLTEIAQFSGLPLSTTHRLVSQIAVSGLVQRGENGRYHVGALLTQLAHSWSPPVDHRLSIGGALEDLATATGHPARFGVLGDNLRVSYFERPSDMRRGLCVPGSGTVPASSSAMGRAILAHLPPHVVERHIQEGLADTPDVTVRAAKLCQELLTVRQRGIAVSRGSGQDRPHWALAAPVFGRGDQAVGALELMIPDFTGDGARSVIPALVVAARSLSRCFADPFNHFPSEPDLFPPLRVAGASVDAGTSEPAYAAEAAV